MLEWALCLWGCTPDSNSIFGGNLGDSYYCMPGPPSATFKGTTDVTFCDDELNNGTIPGECNHPQYQKTPEESSLLEYTTAKVIPGPTCRPNPDFTQSGFYNSSASVRHCTLDVFFARC